MKGQSEKSKLVSPLHDAGRLRKGKSEYARQMKVAEGLLKKYPFFDLELIIKYVVNNPQVEFYSLVFLNYAFDEMLEKAKEWESRIIIESTPKVFATDEVNVVQSNQRFVNNNKRKLRGGAFNDF